MKTQIALACVVAIVVVATVAAYDSRDPSMHGSVVEEFREGLQQASESKTNVSLFADGKEFGGVPTNVADGAVTLQGPNGNERLLVRLDRITSLVLMNSEEQKAAAEQAWDAAQTKSILSTWGTAKLSGTVTLDGNPLEGVEIRFYFNEDPVQAITNSEGRYALFVKRGRDDLGETRVRFYWPKGQEGPIEIPDRYGRGSSLTADIKPGENSFDFALQSE